MASHLRSTPLAPWSLRLAVFSLQLFIAALVLHRFAGLPTAVAFNIMIAACTGAVLSLVAGLFAFVRIWSDGVGGIAAVAGASLTALGLLAGPVLYLPSVSQRAIDYDVSTDAATPPEFQALAEARAADIGPMPVPVARALRPGARIVKAEPLITTRSPSDCFDLANDVVKALDLNIVAEEAPGFDSAAGVIEATDRTMVMGLVDDIVIRINPEGEGARIDVRSAARFPRLDLGRNGDRVVRILHQLQASLDASVPSDTVTASANAADSVSQQPAGTAGQASVVRRKKRVRAPTDAQGAQAPTTSLR